MHGNITTPLPGRGGRGQKREKVHGVRERRGGGGGRGRRRLWSPTPHPPADMWLATSISVQAGSLLTTTGAHRVGKASKGACDYYRP